jgi:hypothetical protein
MLALPGLLSTLVDVQGVRRSLASAVSSASVHQLVGPIGSHGSSAELSRPHPHAWIPAVGVGWLRAMSWRAVAPDSKGAARTLEDPNLGRLLLSLRRDTSAVVSVATLLADGLRAPVQSVYELQMADYDIHRIQGQHDTYPYRRRTPVGQEAGRDPIGTKIGSEVRLTLTKDEVRDLPEVELES